VRRDVWRVTEPDAVLSEFESSALASVAAQAVGYGIRKVSAGPPFDASEEEKRKYREEEQQRREKEEVERKEAIEKFAAAVNERLAKAYDAGANAAVERADRSNFNARSITLYLVVLAVVAMPVIAMIIKLNPQTFGKLHRPCNRNRRHSCWLLVRSA
jgi:hypothetical protein